MTQFKSNLTFEEEVRKRLGILEAESGSSTFVNSSGGEPLISTTAFTVSSVISTTWESVGPTGAGADNTWTALDGVPTDVDWIVVKIYAYAYDNDASSNYCLTYARKNGSSASVDTTTIVSSIRLGGEAGFVRYVGDTSFVYIPVSSVMFDLYLSSNMDNETVTFYLAGYGYNS